MIKFSRDPGPLDYSHDPPFHLSWRWGEIDVNEGGGPANFSMQWLQPWCWIFVYVYVLGYRCSWTVKRRQGHSS